MTAMPCAGPASSAGVVEPSRERGLCGVILGLSMLVMIAHLAMTWRNGPSSSDFFVFWSTARILAGSLLETVADLYDPQALTALQQHYRWHTGEFHPFVYPPTMLPVIRPLAMFDYPSAEFLWLAVSLGILGWAVEGHRKPVRLLVIAAAPASLVNIAFGQTGFWTAALLAGGLLRLDRAPVCAGILIGLATIKPQLGLMIPLVLILARAWTVLVAATLTTGMMVALSALFHGFDLWLSWLAAVKMFSGQMTVNLDHLLPWLGSLAATLMSWGLSPPVAQLGQLALILALAAMLAGIARRTDRPALIAAGLAATFAATPFCYAYDSVLLVPAVMLAAERMLLRSPSGPHLRLTLVAVWFAPFLSIGLMPHGLPVLPLAATALVGCLRAEERSRAGGQPATEGRTLPVTVSRLSPAARTGP
ncbi:MAG: DUF2029 domain-containing protein [Geminicoccaceae bacterium]|nr:DUF2029 domain-containing protein [Geminicoccaceae bacterium]